MKSISVPFQFFTESDGTPLDNGNIYIGTENLNPETNPVQVWADLAGTIPLSQPIRTSDGYMVRYGTPVNVFVDSAYSITVKNKNGELVYTLPSSAVITESSGSGNVVDDFGAVPDNPLIDNTDSFNEAFSSSNGQIFIPAGTYNIDSLLIIDCDNLEVYGVEGATILSSANLVELAQIVRMENVNFYGITFELTTASGLPSRGVVFADDPLITNSSFVRCTQTAPNCKAGGFMVDGTGVINTFDLTDNIVFDVGGKGIYFSATEYKNVTVTGGIVKNTALYTLENGDGVTFSEGGSQSTIDGIAISNTFGTCIKLDSVSDIFVTNNRFSDLSRICDVIDSAETSARNVSITYFNNETVGRVFDGSVNIVAHDNPQLSQNRWYLTGAFHLTDTIKLKSSGDMIDSTFVNAVLVDGDSNNNEWIGGIITNAVATPDAANVTVLNSGADVFATRIVSVEIYKEPTLGIIAAGALTAPIPELVLCSGDFAESGYSQTIGLKTLSSFPKTGSVGIPGAFCSIFITVNPDQAEYTTYIIKATVACMKDDGTGSQYYSDSVHYMSVNNTDMITPIPSQEAGTLTIVTVEVSANKVRLDASAVGVYETMEFMWDLEIIGIGDVLVELA